MKKAGLILLSVLLMTGMVLPVMADDDEDVYYLTMCSGSDLSEEQKNECREYASRRNSELAQQLSDIKAKRQEIEKDLAKISCDLELYDLYTKGFIEGCGGILTDMEIKCLPIGANVMTYECGMRFLADYLSGVTYFKIAYPEHNLDRARTQLKLVADMEAKWDQMEKIVEKYL